MFGSRLLPVVCRRAHVLFTLVVFVCVCPTRLDYMSNMCLITDKNSLPFASTWVHTRVRGAHLFSLMCCVLFVVVRLRPVSPMLPVSLDCLRSVSCAPNVTSVSRLSSFCVLCTQCYQCLWIVFVLCLVYPMLPVSLDCLRPVSCVPNVTRVSGLSSFCVLCTQCYQCLWIVFVLCLV